MTSLDSCVFLFTLGDICSDCDSFQHLVSSSRQKHRTGPANPPCKSETCNPGLDLENPCEITQDPSKQFDALWRGSSSRCKFGCGQTPSVDVVLRPSGTLGDSVSPFAVDSSGERFLPPQNIAVACPGTDFGNNYDTWSFSITANQPIAATTAASPADPAHDNWGGLICAYRL
jgi:hypothetical protein